MLEAQGIIFLRAKNGREFIGIMQLAQPVSSTNQMTEQTPDSGAKRLLAAARALILCCRPHIGENYGQRFLRNIRLPSRRDYLASRCARGRRLSGSFFHFTFTLTSTPA